MKSIQQSFRVTFHYDVYFTEHIFSIDNALFSEVIQSGNTHLPASCMFVIDQGVIAHHADLVQQIHQYFLVYADQLKLAADPLVVTGGEAVKNEHHWIEKILKAVNNHRIDRHSYIVGIGGGAVLDMVGYAASIAHRGVRHVRIPTTVLSQNDSGVGVKNGINYFGKKNFVGNFAPPFAVINDFTFLETLDERDWRSGISEAIKVALIKDLSFFERLEQDATALSQRQMPPMERLIYDCAKLHLEHISGGDPFEMGSSRPLDFGHWSAHKLEQLTQYSLRHGEAVAIGIALDVTYSYLDGRLSQSELERVMHLLLTLGFDLYVPELAYHLDDRQHPDSILHGLEEFREHLGGELTIMLLDELGKGVEVHELDNKLLVKAVERLETYSLQALAR